MSESHCDMHMCTHMHTHILFDLCADEAVQAFVTDLQANPESGADLAQNLIGRLQKGSMVRNLQSIVCVCVFSCSVWVFYYVR